MLATEWLGQKCAAGRWKNFLTSTGGETAPQTLFHDGPESVRQLMNQAVVTQNGSNDLQMSLVSMMCR
jgi:hypothetical protein